MAQMAVIKTGGKQYVVTPGKKLKVEKLAQEEGSDVVFNEVLLVENDPSTLQQVQGRPEEARRATSSEQAIVKIGTPFVEGAKVKGKVLKQGKGKKVVIFKYKAKKREQTKKGHRQPFSEVQITSIESK